MILRRFFAILLLLPVIFCYGSVTLQNNFNQNINTFLNKTKEKYSISAISLSVVFPDGIEKTFVSGIVNNNSNILITPQNLFWMNSITKSFTAALALKLATKHELNLNATVTDYLPQYSKWEHITIKQLLNQTSGIFDYIDTPHWFDNLAKQPNKIWSSEELVALAYSGPNCFKPGQGWHYSNTNYVLLGMIIEKITKQPIGESFNQQLFSPLKLQHTFYITGIIPDFIKKNLVHGYVQNIDVSEQNPSWSQAAGAIIANTEDMALWFHDLMNEQIITGQAFNTFTTLVSVVDGKTVSLNTRGNAYGMGVFYGHISNEPVWFIPGESSGYRSLVAYFPREHIIYALAVNNGLVYKPQFIKDALKSLLQITLTMR